MLIIESSYFKSPNRICNDFVVIRGQFIKGRIKVLIVGDTLGY